MCEIEGLPEDAQGHLELISPFADVDPGQIEPLTLCPSQTEALLARKASMLIGRAFDADTLCELLPMRGNHLFGSGGVSYRLDGTPVFDHSKIVSYDPLLVESINIYPYIYLIGSRYFNGVVDIVTYKKNLPSMTFGDNVRVYDFDGAAFPLALTCRGVNMNENYPDLRQTARLCVPSVNSMSDKTSISCS